jgi:hypothetical protein
MVEKPDTGDERQRREQTGAARRQSGLPPERQEAGPRPDADTRQEEERRNADTGQAAPHGQTDADEQERSDGRDRPTGAGTGARAHDAERPS